MDNELLLNIYLIGVVIYSLVLIDKLEPIDVLTSIIVGAVWPIALPVRALKKVLR